MSLHQNLEWLPQPSQPLSRPTAVLFADHAILRKALSQRPTEKWLSQLAQVARKLPEAPDFLTPFTVTILGNANFEMMEKVIEGAALRHGFHMRVSFGHMGQIAAAAFDPTSPLNTQTQDAVVIALTHQYFFNPSLIGQGDKANDFLDAIFSEIETVAGVQRAKGGQLFVQTVPNAGPSVLGMIETNVPGSPAHLISTFNDRLRASDYAVIDTQTLAENIGHAAWESDHYWFWAKFPFHPNNNLAYANHLGRAFAVARGGTKKCLILDLDNTLWKGVIGDDGMSGIEIGNNSPNGEAHLAIQTFALALKARGVVLAVCSKNTHEVALEPFQSHSEMALKEDDIAVFVANWGDKANNIRRIAEELSLGTDSFVFLDDNPMERDIVRQELPEVEVPEVDGKNPAGWLSVVSAAGYFDATSFTDTDRSRAEQYTANRKRKEIEATTTDLTAYLKALDMELSVAGFHDTNRSRVSQLINRSNQFNLTTRRYTEEDIAAFEGNDGVLNLAFRLTDKFGDNGIIAIIIGRVEANDLVIDTWVMSCRVLRRNVETACLVHLVDTAKARGLTHIVGDYFPTKKNGMVANHYAELGFESHGTVGTDGTRWRLAVDSFPETDALMHITQDN